MKENSHFSQLYDQRDVYKIFAKPVLSLSPFEQPDPEYLREKF